MRFFSRLRPLIFALPAESAHKATISALKLLPRVRTVPHTPAMEVTVAGLTFPNPVGLAAGFDKDAEVFEPMLGFGFGFVEVGTVTPRPQKGNPRPRLFRLEKDRAVINRMGFNNQGQDKAFARLDGRRNVGIVGVNIGANKDSEDRIADYVAGVIKMAPVADYLTINISSPNTPGLRDLQAGCELDRLLAAIAGARAKNGPPIFLKVAPDLEKGDHGRVVKAVLNHGLDAIIVANTTLSRPALQSGKAGEAGGLSGAPLKDLALEQLRLFRKASKGKIPLIAAGGIENGADAYARIKAGASLVQLYSAMVYEGPGIAHAIVSDLGKRMRRHHVWTVAELVGSE